MPHDGTEPTRQVKRDPDWRRRECDRFYRLENPYIYPVWSNEGFWYNATTGRDHFVHVSPKDPGVLLYTQSPDKGERDIQTPIKAGRYLAKYFGKVLSEKEIKFFATWQAEGRIPSTYNSDPDWELRFAETADEIVDVYVRGPSSCMDGRHFEPDRHPCRVYAAGDLAVAYLYNEKEDEGRQVRGRCLVWPDKKIAGRVYPTPDFWSSDGFRSHHECEACRQALRDKLRAIGYKFCEESEKARFDGARIAKILYRNRKRHFVMPYLDYGYGVNDCGDHFEMSLHRYDCRCDETSGVIELEDNDVWVCDHCSEEYEDGDAEYTVYMRCTERGGRTSQRWCEGCFDTDGFECEGCHDAFSDIVDSIVVTDEAGDAHTYARAWAVAHDAYQSEVTGAWFFESDDPRVVVNGFGISTSERDRGVTTPEQMTIHDPDQVEMMVVQRPDNGQPSHLSLPPDWLQHRGWGVPDRREPDPVHAYETEIAE